VALANKMRTGQKRPATPEDRAAKLVRLAVARARMAEIRAERKKAEQ